MSGELKLLSNKKGHGRITRVVFYEVNCGKCGVCETLENENRESAERNARGNLRWKHSRLYGWLCRFCSAEEFDCAFRELHGYSKRVRLR